MSFSRMDLAGFDTYIVILEKISPEHPFNTETETSKKSNSEGKL